MPDVRSSPSGNLVSVDVSLLSVFGRVGNVVAEPDDYDTDEVENLSSVSGATWTDALESLATSDSRANDSDVVGSTLTAALDSLLAGQTPYLPGTMRETFAGGVRSASVAGNSVNMGDFGWNLQAFGTSSGARCDQLSGTASSFGIYRMQSPTSATVLPAGLVCSLGSGGGAGTGPLRWDQLSECTWRARFDPSTATLNLSFKVGFHDATAATAQCGFLVQMLGTGSDAHYQAFAFNTSLGGSVTAPSSVLVDGNFHDFRIVRTNATTLTYFIDGVQVAQINDATAVPAASQVVFPVFIAATNTLNAQTASFVDVDDFVLLPVAA